MSDMDEPDDIVAVVDEVCVIVCEFVWVTVDETERVPDGVPDAVGVYEGVPDAVRDFVVVPDGVPDNDDPADELLVGVIGGDDVPDVVLVPVVVIVPDGDTVCVSTKRVPRRRKTNKRRIAEQSRPVDTIGTRTPGMGETGNCEVRRRYRTVTESIVAPVRVVR